MNIQEYRKKAKEFNYMEVPDIIDGSESKLHDFLSYKDLDNELRIYLTRMLTVRSISITGGTYLPADVDWWIENFIKEFEFELSDYMRLEAVKKAMTLIQKEDPFGGEVVGTVYMFTAIEYYAKCKLGLNLLTILDGPELEKAKFNSMSIGVALNKVKKCDFIISRELWAIDNANKAKAIQMGFSQQDIFYTQLANRINLVRNRMLHGHVPFHHGEGTLLALIYILFHFCQIQEIHEEERSQKG